MSICSHHLDTEFRIQQINQSWYNNIIFCCWVCLLQRHVCAVLILCSCLLSCFPVGQQRDGELPAFTDFKSKKPPKGANSPHSQHADDRDNADDKRHSSDRPGEHTVRVTTLHSTCQRWQIFHYLIPLSYINSKFFI